MRIRSPLINLPHSLNHIAHPAIVNDRNTLSHCGVSLAFLCFFGGARFPTQESESRQIFSGRLVVGRSHTTVKNIVVSLSTVDPSISGSQTHRIILDIELVESGPVRQRFVPSRGSFFNLVSRRP